MPMSSQQQFDAIQVELAQELLSLVPDRAAFGDEWLEAFLESRFDPGGSNLVKCRVRLRNGSLVGVVSSVRITVLLDDYFVSLSPVKRLAVGRVVVHISPSHNTAAGRQTRPDPPSLDAGFG